MERRLAPAECARVELHISCVHGHQHRGSRLHRALTLALPAASAAQRGMPASAWCVRNRLRRGEFARTPARQNGMSQPALAVFRSWRASRGWGIYAGRRENLKDRRPDRPGDSSCCPDTKTSARDRGAMARRHGWAGCNGQFREWQRAVDCRPDLPPPRVLDGSLSASRWSRHPGALVGEGRSCRRPVCA